VSSYTPTIRTLIDARRARAAANVPGQAGSERVLVVAMPHTPGAGDLPGAEAEADLLRQRFGDRAIVLAGHGATHEAVTRALPEAAWAHFACHGHSDLASPSNSCLLLDDHEQRPLTVTDVARLRLDDADLAFLSACSTASPSGRLPDEAIHLASAFQLAGYRHVIGTLWPIRDREAVEYAKEVYQALTGIEATGAATALHAVTLKLRSRWLPTPSVWASHIHVGP
jgi:CHAT domain-containing protein